MLTPTPIRVCVLMQQGLVPFHGPVDVEKAYVAGRTCKRGSGVSPDGSDKASPAHDGHELAHKGRICAYACGNGVACEGFVRTHGHKGKNMGSVAQSGRILHRPLLRCNFYSNNLLTGRQTQPTSCTLVVKNKFTSIGGACMSFYEDRNPGRLHPLPSGLRCRRYTL